MEKRLPDIWKPYKMERHSNLLAARGVHYQEMSFFVMDITEL